MNLRRWAGKAKRFALRNKYLSGTALGGIAICFGLVLFSYFYVGSYQKYVLKDGINSKSPDEYISIGIVFGSGITNEGKPYKELQGRLDAAAEVLAKGNVELLLLTGDNRFKNYNEPQAMENYLVNIKHVDSQKLVLDYAGRSTYESCQRASEIFGVGDALLFSAPTHLPRALFTCRKFGITAYGVAAGDDANNATRREFLARCKAMFNVYIYGEKTILGPKISL